LSIEALHHRAAFCKEAKSEPCRVCSTGGKPKVLTAQFGTIDAID
jgi:hypothetical protein